MDLNQLTAGETRHRLEICRDRIEMSNLMLRCWNERIDPKFVAKEIKKQQDIIDEALCRIEDIKGWKKRAHKEIEKLERSKRYEEKHKKLLENRVVILKLIAISEKINEIKEDNPDQFGESFVGLKGPGNVLNLEDALCCPEDAAVINLAAGEIDDDEIEDEDEPEHEIACCRGQKF